MIKSRRMHGWDEKFMHNFSWKPGGKWRLGRTRHRWENIIDSKVSYKSANMQFFWRG
jgi:hypothetical protein